MSSESGPAGAGWTGGSPSVPEATAAPGTSGEVRNLEQRTEEDSVGRIWSIWTFRLERHDGSGNRMPPVPVEMRGLTFNGFLSEGDLVEIPSTDRSGDGLLTVTRVRNVTTRSMVVARDERTREKFGLVVFGILALIVLGILFLVLRRALSS